MDDPSSTAQPPRLSRRRTATLERLLDAALEVFAEAGFQGASIEDICARAGFTRGAFYSSFSSKDELFLALHRREVEGIMRSLTSWVDGLEEESDPLHAAVDRFLSSFEVNRTWHLVHAEFTLHAMRDPVAAAALVEHSDQLLAQLSELIERAVGATGCRLLVDAGDVARLIVAVHQGSVDWALLRNDLSDAVRLERWFLPLLLGTVAGPFEGQVDNRCDAGSNHAADFNVHDTRT